MADGKIVIKIDMDKSDFENNDEKVIKINVNTNGSDENEEEPKTAAESEAGGAVTRKKKKNLKEALKKLEGKYGDGIVKKGW